MSRGMGRLLALVLAVLVGLTGCSLDLAEPATQPTTGATSGAVDSQAAQERVDPASGLDWINEADLPPEAVEILALIDAGGPYDYDKDGSVFGNFEGLLPERQRGWYREYTVETPGLNHRGARRIVTGGEDEFYWTADHYESFERIRRTA